jgi:hypothetical protein
MFTHDYCEKIAIKAIKDHIYEFDESHLKEIAYSATGFDDRVFIFSYNININRLYVITIHRDKSIDVESYLHECGYSI